MKVSFGRPDPLRTTQILAGVCIAALLGIIGVAALGPRTGPGLAVEQKAPPLVEPAEAAELALSQQGKKAVQVGFYLNRISEVSHKDGTLNIDAWLWFRWQDKEMTPFSTFELVNGEIEERSATEVIEDDGYQYSSVRMRAKVFQPFDVERYPFDNHTIGLAIEDSNSEFELMEYLPDQGSMIDPSVSLHGWNVKLKGVSSSPHSYPTNYGFRSLGSNTSTYSRFLVELDLIRHESLVTVVKLFWVSYLALILAVGACFVKSSDLDARFGLGLGAIFAASANTIAVSAELPDTPIITLAEQINIVTVVAIFFTIFLSIVSLRLRHAGREQAAEILDFSGAGSVAILYVAALWIIFVGL
jgi:hypothetical protein